jgi:hypothetical protein
MPYTRAETIGTTAPHPLSLDPASVSQVLRGGPAVAHDVEAFWQAISLQAAARTARYAETSPVFSDEAAGAFHTIGIQREKRARAPLGPSFNLVMASGIGVVVFACIAYFIAGGNLLLRH